MTTEISYQNEARLKMLAGVDKLANAVKVTMGAAGRNVTIRDERTRKPRTTKDGVTVARVINLVDPVEDMGAQLVKAAAEKTASLAGDGTTTSTLLAQVIINEGIRHISNNQANPVAIKRGIDMAVTAVVKNLKEQSQDVDADGDNLVNVATISANNDHELGRIVADAMKRVGSDGVVTLAESKTADTFIERVDGLMIDKGYITPYFATNPHKMTAEFDNALIFLYDRKISLFMDIEPMLNYAIVNKKPLLIIAEDMEGEALATMVMNKNNPKSVPFAAIKLPGFGNMSLQMLEDIATIVGGTVISESKGDIMKNIKLGDYVGRAAKITINSVSTTITGGHGKKENVEARIESVKALIESNPNDIEKEKLRKWRLAKLVNGVAVIHVGATTELEMREKKDRLDDSLCATKAAMEEGILPGGGVAYIRALNALQYLTSENKDEQKGIDIILVALKHPLMQMVLNAGEPDIDTIMEKVIGASGDYGYNVKTRVYENFLQTGIIDPAKVARVALENAASVASMFLTTECAIVDYQQNAQTNVYNNQVQPK